MSRRRLWLRWSWRDLRSRWLLVSAIALIIAIGTGLYTGLGSMKDWRTKSNDASFRLLNAHDLKVSLTEGSYAKAARLQRIARTIPSARQVSAVEERLVVPTQMDASHGGETVINPGQLVGVDVRHGGPHVDGIAVEGGRALTPADSGRPVAILEATYADLHHLPDAGSVRVAGGRTLHYVGIGRSPEYFLVTRPGGGDFGGSESSFGILFAPLRTVQLGSGHPGQANQMVLKLRPSADRSAVRSQLEASFARRLPGVGAQVSTLQDEPAYRVLYEDAKGDQTVFNIFALLILGGAALASFNLASRIVEAERREIGVGMALGVPPRELAIRPLLLGAEIAFAGAAFGILLGLLFSDLFRGVLEDLLPLPVIRSPFEPSVFVRGALIGFLLPFVATAIPVWRGVRVAPIEAIRVGFRSAKSGGLAPLLKWLRLPGRSLTQMPFRNVLRAPRRTVMTVLGIAAVITVVVAMLGMIDSFLGTVDRSEAVTKGASPSRMTVTLDDVYPRGARPLRAIARAPAVGAAEPWLVVPGKLRSGGESFDAILQFSNPRSPIWRPTLSEGPGLRPGRPGVLIAGKAAEDLGVGVGDTIAIRHPARGAGSEFKEATSRVPVVGIHPNPFRIFAYMDGGEAARMGLGGLVNQVAVTPAPGHTQGDVTRSLFTRPGVASVEAATAITDVVRDRMNDFVDVLRLTELFALFLAVLIAFNSASINADERTRETATMFAFGVPVRAAIGLAVIESVVIGVIGTLVGLGAGLLVLQYIVHTNLPQTIPELGLQVSISTGTLLVTALVGVVAVGLVPLLTTRRLRRTDVPSALRVVE